MTLTESKAENILAKSLSNRRDPDLISRRENSSDKSASRAGNLGNLDLLSTARAAGRRGEEGKGADERTEEDRFWLDANNGTADVDSDTARDGGASFGRLHRWNPFRRSAHASREREIRIPENYLSIYLLFYVVYCNNHG